MNHQQVRDFFALNHTRPKKTIRTRTSSLTQKPSTSFSKQEKLTETDTVIEIGAGLGCLTDVLMRRAKHVIAVEVDGLLYKALAAAFWCSLQTKTCYTNINRFTCSTP